MPSIQIDHDPQKVNFEELLKRYNVLETIAPGKRLKEIQKNLRVFEDKMKPGETVAVFNYGSNSPESLTDQFQEAQEKFPGTTISDKFGFGAKVSLKDTEIGFGSIGGSRKCPVGTILPNKPGNETVGWIGFFTKEQFREIARRESGDSRAREKGKGRYRRSLVYIADPRDPDGKKELPVVTFVLDDSGQNQNHKINKAIIDYPLKEENEIISTVKEASERASNECDQEKRKLLQEMPLKMNEYLSEVQKQRLEATKTHRKQFGNDQSIAAHWNSKKIRDSRR